MRCSSRSPRRRCRSSGAASSRPLTEAIRIALSEPQGPVHLDLPEDVALAPTNEQVAAPAQPATLAAAPDAAIARAAELIAAAKRPIAVIGSSAMRLADPLLLRKIVERHSLPFATTTMAKGMIDEDHPLSLGCIERACRQVQRKLLRSADLIVGLGYDTIEVEYEAWIDDRPLLQIDIEPVDVAPTVKLVHQVTGDLASSLARLLAQPAATNVWDKEKLAEHRRHFQATLRPAANPPPRNPSPHMPRSMRCGVRCRARDCCHSTSARTRTRSPANGRRTRPRPFTSPMAGRPWASGCPGAIAAKLARPDLPVVCVLGDGCFQMTCGEVATAKRLGITLPVVVLDDRWLALIKVKQIRRQFPLYGTELQTEDYRAPPAHYFGVPAVAANSADALEHAVKAALAAKGPTVIEAVVDSDHYVDTVYD